MYFIQQLNFRIVPLYVLFRVEKENQHSRGQHYGNGIIEDTFTEEKSIEFNINLELMEDGKDSH